MRRLVQGLSRRMVVKVFAATATVVGFALVLVAWLQAREEVAALKLATREQAQQIADLVVGSIEHAMLEGDGIAVKTLVTGFKARVPEADIRIFDRHGLEVFGAPPPAPPRASLPPAVQEVLAGGTRRVAGDAAVRPIATEARCQKCHDDDTLRGALAVELDAGAWASGRERLVGDLVRAGFVQVMTARQAERLDDYFEALSATAPGLVAIAVYDREGELSYGKDVAGLSPALIQAALEPGAARTVVDGPGTRVVLVPMPREDRCAQCHKDRAPVRGLLAVALAPPPAGRAPSEELEAIVDTTFRAIMMSSLGRVAVDFLREVVAAGAARRLELYDREGRTFFTSAPPPPDPAVMAALGSASMPPALVGHGAGERVRMTRRLDNGERCTTCHGSDHEARGVVMVSLPNDKALMARESAITRTLVLTPLALILMLGLVYLLLKVFVERPVVEIDAVAAAVGGGDLTARVRQHADPDGDELRRLGARMNEMIQGLRAKFVLEKFVSKGTVEAAATGAVKVSKLEMRSVGERRHVTVLFSDIRGFTAFSETVPPEMVVVMLNRFLRAQAEVVERWQGDIDKFVGDELMAVFQGPDAARRAVRCAVEMLEAVDRVRDPQLAGAHLAVGVGLSSGDVVYGPIGSEKRLDFTVIGDVVNTGARLCSAASGGQVVVSRAVIDDCRGGLGDIEFTPLPPMQVKGKREPLEIYAASRTPGGG